MPRMENMNSDQQRLRRLSLLYQDQPLYFVTSCTHGRQRILATEAAVQILKEEWSAALDRHGWAVGSFVIMPDHVHFFCRDAESRKPLSQFMGAWKQWTSKGIKSRVQLSAPVWQEGFFDHILRSDESFREKWNYVRDNPVRAGLAKVSDEWPFQGHVHFE